MSPTLPPPRRKGAGCLVRTGRILLGLLTMLIVLGALGAVYESRARAQELSRVSPPGQLVDVVSHRLHMVCLGEKAAGRPTVILEAGVGGWSMHWRAFQRQVAPFSRVCAYDRAGLGWSEVGPPLRDGQQVAAQLHALLVGAGESPPYLLVGASRGGQYVRLYRDAFPEEVVGLVLVDAEPEDFRAQSAWARSVAGQNGVVFPVLGLLTRMGVLRLLGGDPASAPDLPCLPRLAATLPAGERAAYLAVEGQPKCFDTIVAEEAATDQREAQLRQVRPLGDLPLIVLARGTPPTPPGGTSAGQPDEVEQAWFALQQQLAGLSTRVTLVRATRSGHNIHLDQPELVLDAIHQLLGQP